MTRSSSADAPKRRARSIVALAATAMSVCAPRGAASQTLALPVPLRVSIDSGLETIDDNALAPADGASRLGVELSGERKSRRGVLRVWTGATAGLLWQAPEAPSIAGAATIDGSFVWTRRTQLSFTERLSATPMDLFTSLGSGGAARVPGAVVNGTELPTLRTLAHNGTFGVTRALGARSQATFGLMQSVSRSGDDSSVSAGGNGRIAHRVGRFGGWHAGYGFVAAQSTVAGARVLDRRHDLDLGVDYARALSLWRDTRFGVTTGATLLTGHEGQSVRANVGARLEHRLAKRWAISADYSRPIEYVAGVTDPLISDAVHLGAHGMLASQIPFVINAGVASGTVGIQTASRYQSYNASVTFARQFGPFLSLQVECHDAWYRFTAAPAADIPAAFTRRGLRMGLVWVPSRRS